MSQVAIGDDAIVMGGQLDLRVLDAKSGRLRWRRDGMASALVIGETVAYGTTAGAVVSRSLRDGTLRWKRGGVCTAPRSGMAGRVSVIVRNADDFIAGCFGGGVARIAAGSGVLRARAENALFSADQVGDIVPLHTCALAVTGWSSGAAMRPHAAILDCKRLRAIVADRQQMWVLGSIGNVAVLDVVCCSRRLGGYRPATIVRANLTTGALSPEVDLTPEPGRYPANERQDAIAMLDGHELYVIVDRSLYGYGDPRALRASPQRIAADLADFPVLLSHGLMAMRVRVAGGAIADEIVRIRNGTLEPVWSAPELGSIIFGYEPGVARDVVKISHSDGTAASQLFVRLPDGAQLSVTDPCQLWAANQQIVVTLCTTNEVVGNRYRQYVAAYRWPGRSNKARQAITK